MSHSSGGRIRERRPLVEPVIFEEMESAAKARPVLDRMLADVRAGRVQAVAVWALDRLHRSMVGAINAVLELDRLGVRVLSVREGWLDTGGPVRPLLVAIFGWVAEQERTRLIERTKTGLERSVARESVWGDLPRRQCCCTPLPTAFAGVMRPEPLPESWGCRTGFCAGSWWQGPVRRNPPHRVEIRKAQIPAG